MTNKFVLACGVLVIVGHSLHSQSYTQIVEIVQRFISPRASMVQLTKADPISGDVIQKEPAAFQLQGQFVRPDIAFAENTAVNKGANHILSINILRSEGDGYRIVFTKTYYDRVIFAQNFKTIGFQEIKLSDGRVGMLVITSSGASLGGDPEIFTWEEGVGYVNVIPPEVGGGYHFLWADDRGKLRLQILYSKGKYNTNAPPAVLLIWNEQTNKMEIVK